MPCVCFIWNVRLYRMLNDMECQELVSAFGGRGNRQGCEGIDENKIQVQFFQFCFLYDLLFILAVILFFPCLLRHYFKKLLFSFGVFCEPPLVLCFLRSLDVDRSLFYLWSLFLIPFLKLDLIQQSQLPVQVHLFLYITCLFLIGINLKADFFGCLIHISISLKNQFQIILFLCFLKYKNTFVLIQSITVCRIFSFVLLTNTQNMLVTFLQGF